MEKLDLQSPDLTTRNVEALAELFPTVVTETRDADGTVRRGVDFDLLRQELSDHVVEGEQERYRLDWPGKRKALLAANAPIRKTLRPVREESVNFDTTKNLFIEGDNLEALKLLQESYLGKVKLIYIDPPYNTGNDFIYNDDFAETTADYLARSGQVDEAGTRFAANTESDGRFHSDWLSMMYPRLKLARKLLRNDGILFVSIDDHEAENLIKLGKELFGHNHHIATFTWVKKRKGSHLSKTVRSMTEYVVCFARDTTYASLVGEAAYTDKWQPLAKRTNARKSLKFPAATVATTLEDGKYSRGFHGRGTSGLTLEDDLVVAGGVVLTGFSVLGPFVWNQDKLDAELRLGTRVALSKHFGFNALRHDQEDKVKRPSTLIDKAVGAGTNEDAYEEALAIFEAEGVMDYPKPTSLIKYLVRTATWSDPTGVVMDFFAGSGTAGQAVVELNAEDGGTRQFIVVQAPERVASHSPAAKLGLTTVADVGKERLRRTGRNAITPTQENPVDVGFRVLKVDSPTTADVGRTPADTSQDQLAMLTDSVTAGRTGEDLLFHVLLDWGLELSLPITREAVAGSELLIVDDGLLIGCFAQTVTRDVIAEVAQRKPERAVFRDSGFTTDADRINAQQVFAQLAPHTELRTV